MREALGWSHAPFVVPEEIYAHWDARESGAQAEASWNGALEGYRSAYPELADEFERRMRGELPDEFMKGADDFIAQCVANESMLPRVKRHSRRSLLRRHCLSCSVAVLT